MAEQVQEILDSFVEPLRELQEKKVLSPEEIHQVVERRREYEYALKRRTARQADFLQYIQDEIKLARLCELRGKRLKVKRAEKHAMKNIHILWIRLLRKFKTVELYLEYAKFCQEHDEFNRLKSLYAQAIQFFPKSVALWIEAASHEFFRLGSAQNARILLQQGIRVNPKAQELWMQSFALELHFLFKLRGRREVLQQDATFDTKIAQLVYNNAIKEIPDNVVFRLKFLEKTKDFPDTEDLQKHIMNTIDRDCRHQPESWIARIEYEQSKDDEVATGFTEVKEPLSKKRKVTEVEDRVLDLMREAVEAIPKDKMYFTAILYLTQYYQEQEGATAKACRKLIDEIYHKAVEAEAFNEELILHYVDFLRMHGSNKDAVKLMQEFTSTKPQECSATLWITLAQTFKSYEETKMVLEKGASGVAIDGLDHKYLLLSLLGLEYQHGAPFTSLLSILEKLLLLFSSKEDDRQFESPFGVSSIPEACLATLRKAVQDEGIVAARKVYKQVLLKSSAVEMFRLNEHFVVFLDETLRVERQEGSEKELLFLYDCILKLFNGTDLYDHYREKRETDKVNLRKYSPSILDASRESFVTDFEEAYAKSRVAHIKNLQGRSNKFSHKKLLDLYTKLPKKDRDTWCVETGDAKSIKATDFLGSDFVGAGYCSFLVQAGDKEFEALLDQLPVIEIPGTLWSYESALWIFFGRNPGTCDLDGRPEHTDSVSHDGTWHYQLSGRKTWIIRPSDLLTKMTGQTEPRVIRCEEGDVIVIDTKLWFHRTVIPPQPTPSISYARDFHNGDLDGTTMSNVDGIYATKDIEEGTLLFDETTMPDCKLHRSSDPNCAVMTQEDDTMAIVTIKNIPAGDFLCVAETDDEDESDEG